MCGVQKNNTKLTKPDQMVTLALFLFVFSAPSLRTGTNRDAPGKREGQAGWKWGQEGQRKRKARLVIEKEREHERRRASVWSNV